MPVTFQDTGLKKLKANIGMLDGFTLEVGVDPRARYPDGTPVALVGLFLEFGTSKMRALPFMRTTLFANSATIRRQWAEQVAQVVANRQTPLQAMSFMGRSIGRMTVDTILNSTAWARQLEASTVAAKGHGIPLQDTLKLSRSIQWLVRGRGGRIAARGKS
jgi:hypothetical protein